MFLVWLLRPVGVLKFLPHKSHTGTDNVKIVSNVL